jgi:multicomponent Na+:H+ antiporter subunit D
MNAPHAWLPVCIICSSLVPGSLIFFLRQEQHRVRIALNLFGAVAKIALVGALIRGVAQQQVYVSEVPLLSGIDFKLHADPMSLLFAALSAVLWLLTTLYAIGYLEDRPNASRFFGFFSYCVSATTGIALAGNLLTLLVFYEMLTLSTYPLVVHWGTKEAMAAGRVYLAYTLGGGALLMLGVVWLRALVGPLDFVSGGFLANAPIALHGKLALIFVLLIVGFGVKAALVPLHGWLPRAMVAPAPVSALLHAVAVVKAGAFGVARTVYDVYGVRLVDELDVGMPLAVAAALTILYGSVLALYQDDLKRRLAYSTVSQVSYIILGAAILGPLATLGGLVHLVHQGLMKITLFFAAGNLAETLGIHKVSEMRGCGRRMPLTMAAFSICALGMIGIPPTAGFVSKWYLAQGGLAAGQPWVVLVLVASSLLNAAYFLPILHAAWFCPQDGEWPHERAQRGRVETAMLLLVPPVATAFLALAAGLFAASAYSPLAWAKFIVTKEY